MTYSRFKHLWMRHIGNRPPVTNPIAVDEMRPHTIDALVAASRGDFTVFDEIGRRLDERDRNHDLSHYPLD